MTMIIGNDDHDDHHDDENYIIRNQNKNFKPSELLQSADSCACSLHRKVFNNKIIQQKYKYINPWSVHRQIEYFA